LLLLAKLLLAYRLLSRPLAIREVARRFGRDVKAVHGDILAPINAGVIDQTENGVVFPYDAVHVDLMLKAA